MVSGGNVKKGSTGHPQFCSRIGRLSVHGPATAAPGSGGLHCRKTVVCKVMTSCWQKMHTFRCPFWVFTSVFFMLNKLRHFDSKYYCWISISQKQFSLAFLLKVPSLSQAEHSHAPHGNFGGLIRGDSTGKCTQQKKEFPSARTFTGPSLKAADLK